MHPRRWLTGIRFGSLVVTGLIAAGPLTGSAQQNATPPAQTQSQTAGEDEQASGPVVVGTPLLQPSIDLMRAQELALEGQTGAVVTEVSLDGAGGVLAYRVELDSGMEVDVDATSGAVLKTEQVGEDSDEGNGEGAEENGTEDESGAESEEENGEEQG